MAVLDDNLLKRNEGLSGLRWKN